MFQVPELAGLCHAVTPGGTIGVSSRQLIIRLRRKSVRGMRGELDEDSIVADVIRAGGLMASGSVQRRIRILVSALPTRTGQQRVRPGDRRAGWPIRTCKITTSAKKSKAQGLDTQGTRQRQGGTNGNNGNAGGNGNGGGVDDGSEESKVKQGFAIAPVELNLQGRNRALVGLGSYIVNAQGGCVDCHTSPTYVAGGDPYKVSRRRSTRRTTWPAAARLALRHVREPDARSEQPLTEAQRYADFVQKMRTGIKAPATYTCRSCRGRFTRT